MYTVMLTMSDSVPPAALSAVSDEIVGDDLVIVAEAALPGQEDQVPGTHTLGVAELGGVLQLRNRDDFFDGHVFSAFRPGSDEIAASPCTRCQGQGGQGTPVRRSL